MLGIGPLAQCGLDETLGLSVGSWGIWSGASVFDSHGLTSVTELGGAIAGAVVGQQCAHADAVSGEELHSLVQEADGGAGLLIGQYLGEAMRE